MPDNELQLIQNELKRRKSLEQSTGELEAIRKELERRGIPPSQTSVGGIGPEASAGNLETNSPEQQSLDSEPGLMSRFGDFVKDMFVADPERAKKEIQERNIRQQESDVEFAKLTPIQTPLGEIDPVRGTERILGAGALVNESVLKIAQEKGGVIKRVIDKKNVEGKDLIDLIRPDKTFKNFVEAIKTSQRKGVIFGREAPLKPGEGLTFAGDVLEELGFPEDKKVNLPKIGPVKVSTLLGLGVEFAIPGGPSVKGLVKAKKTAKTLQKGVKAGQQELAEAAKALKEIESATETRRAGLKLSRELGQEELEVASGIAKDIDRGVEIDKITQKAAVPKKRFQEIPVIGKKSPVKRQIELEEIEKRSKIPKKKFEEAPAILGEKPKPKTLITGKSKPVTLLKAINLEKGKNIELPAAAVVGLEVDEETGKIGFDPKMAILGAAGAAAFTRGRKTAFEKAIKKGLLTRDKSKNIRLDISKLDNSKDFNVVLDVLGKSVKNAPKGSSAGISKALGKGVRSSLSDSEGFAAKSMMDKQADRLKSMAFNAAKGKNLKEFDREVSFLENLQKNVLNERAIVGATDVDLKKLGYAIEKTHARDFDAINKLVRESTKPTKIGKFLEFWKLGLLSTPDTQSVNITGNMFRSIERPLKFALRGRSGQARADLQGMAGAFSDGLRAASKTFETGVSGFVDVFDFAPRPQIGGAIGDIIRLPGRSLLAADEFFKTISQAGSLHNQAFKLAKGSAPEMDRLLKNPTRVMLGRARKEAFDATYMTKLGTMGRAIESARFVHPGATRGPQLRALAVNLIVPFYRVPVNITKLGFEWTPLGFFKTLRNSRALKRQMTELGDLQDKFARGIITDRKAYDKAIEKIKIQGVSVDEFETQVVRPVVGSMIAGGLAMSYSNEWITGNGPSNREDRKKWLQTHQPYSVKLPGMKDWLSYKRFEPYSTPFALVADFLDLKRYANEDDGILDIAAVFGRNVANATFMRNIYDFLEAGFSGESWKLERFIGNLGASLVPNVIRKAGRELDPVLRERRGVLGPLKEAIVFTRKDLPPIRDFWGRPIIETALPGERLFFPVKRKKVLDDPVTNEVLRLSLDKKLLKFGGLRRTLGDIELDDELFGLYSEYAGFESYRRIKTFVEFDNFKNLPDPAKAKTMNRIKNQSRKSVRTIIKVGLKGKKSNAEIKKRLNRRFGDIKFPKSDPGSS